MKFGRRMRHFHRYREIAGAFMRNGFGVIVQELDLMRFVPFWHPDHDDQIPSQTTGERIRLFLQELGPTFVKLGQLASTRPDLIPADILSELEKLQDKVPPFPFTEIKAVIESELGSPLSVLFKHFNEKPVAAASVGQVHTATLHSGVKVAVKVQRPNIRSVVQTDLEILQRLANMAENRLQFITSVGIRDLIDELAASLLAELDYTLEGRNAEKIAATFKHNPQVVIPSIYWDLSTQRVLTMEYLEGIRLSERELLQDNGYALEDIAEGIANAIFEQIFIGGMFHADPHPGNVIVLLPSSTSKQADDGNRKIAIGLLDFGLVGRLTPSMKDHFASLVIALRRQSSEGVMKAIDGLGLIPESSDRRKLRKDVDRLREKYYRVSFSDISLGEAIHDLVAIAYSHQIKMPPDFMLLCKTLLTLEGVLTSLDPSFSIFDIAEPFGQRLFLERLHPKRIAETAASYSMEYAALLSELPTQLRRLFDLLQRGKLPLELALPNLGDMIKQLDRISGRLTFSIVLLSFSILMSGLIIGSFY